MVKIIGVTFNKIIKLSSTVANMASIVLSWIPSSDNINKLRTVADGIKNYLDKVWPIKVS